MVILVACGVAALRAGAASATGITMIALLVFFLGVIERRRPLPVALVALGFSFASYYVVGDLLHVPLPRSPWGF